MLVTDTPLNGRYRNLRRKVKPPLPQYIGNTKSKSGDKSRVGNMFDLLTFNDKV